MDITTIMAALSSLAAIVTGLGWIITAREKKLLAKKEVDTKTIENLSKVNDEWQESLSQCDKDREFYRATILQKDGEIKELNKALLEAQREANEAKFECKKLEWCKCTINDCPKRKPPRDFESEL